MTCSKTSGGLQGREPDHRVERSGDDLLIFTAETGEYNIVEVCIDNETRHPIAFQTWDDAYNSMHAYAELFGLELVRNGRSRSTASDRGGDAR